MIIISLMEGDSVKKTQKMLRTATAALLCISAAGCNSSKATTNEISPDLYPEEKGGCREWEWDDETGTYVCDDDSSSYRGYYYYGGTLYRSATALMSNSKYKKYFSQYTPGLGGNPRITSSIGTSGKSTGTTSSNSGSSGFGKGFFGGTGG